MTASSPIALDCESHLIKKGCAAPRMVCLSTYDDSGTNLVDRQKGLVVGRALLKSDRHLVGQNICYDLGVLCAEDPTLLPLVFKALDEGRIHDTMLRQMIIDNATGELKFEYDEDLGQYKKPSSFALAYLVKRHLDKWLGGKDGGDVWRMHYRELDGIPIEEWPEDAKTYAIDDSVYTLQVFYKQEEQAQELFEGITSIWGEDGYIPGEAQTMRAAWGLYLMRLWGVRTDPKATRKLEKQLTQEFEAMREELFEKGLMKIKRKRDRLLARDTKAIQKRVVECYESHGLEPPLTDSGKNISTSRETLRMTKYPEIKPDPDLVLVSKMVAVGKLLTTYIPVLKRGAQVPITPEYNPLIETFRTSCRSPNLQNLPRGGTVRECFVARPGTTFAFCDYSTLEMRTLAQVCLDLFGHSRLAQVLAEGKDAHIILAADMLGISYDEAMSRLAAGDEEIKEARQFCFHPDTEVLTRSGWKRISELSKGEEVAAALPGEDGVCLEWQVPIRLTRRKAPKMLHLKNEGIDLRVTPEHRMVAHRQDGSWVDTTAAELHKKRGWFNAGQMEDGSWNPDERLLRLAVATQADGSVCGHQIRFGFTKNRKIERMRQLLAGIPHKEKTTGEVTSFWVHGHNPYPSGRRVPDGPASKILGMLSGKCFDSRWLNLSTAAREIALDEAAHWDGSCSGKSVSYSFVSMSKQNVDILQAIATQSGRKARATQEKSRAWRLSVRRHPTRKNDRSRGDNLKTTEIEGGDVVCLSVPSTYVLVRDGGVPVITGQCKIGNYGFGGGMGPRAFVDYARGYGIHVSLERATELWKGFRKAWPEVVEYFDYCSNLVDPNEGSALVVQFVRTGLFRGRVPYTAICNGFFQHLAAIGAKDAVYEVQRECYLDKKSPLYGCRAWLFAHDEIGLEIPYTGKRRHEAAMRLQEIMEREMQKWCPGVPIEAEVSLTRRWYKGAPSIKRGGILVPVKPPAPGKKKWQVDIPRAA